MPLFTATFSRPDRWIETALSSDLTPLPASAGPTQLSSAQAVVRHCTEHRSLYTDPCSNEEAAQLLRRLGMRAEAISDAPVVHTSLLEEALREAQEWTSVEEHDLAWSAARDALIAVDAFSGVPSALESLDIAIRLIEGLCARVLGHRAGESLLASDTALAMKAALLIDLVAFGTATHVNRTHGVISHLLAARIFRSRYAHLKGFVRPYRRLTAALSTASTLRAGSILATESSEAVCADLRGAYLSDRLTATAQLYLSEAIPSSMVESTSAAFG